MHPKNEWVSLDVRPTWLKRNNCSFVNSYYLNSDLSAFHQGFVQDPRENDMQEREGWKSLNFSLPVAIVIWANSTLFTAAQPSSFDVFVVVTTVNQYHTHSLLKSGPCRHSRLCGVANSRSPLDFLAVRARWIWKGSKAVADMQSKPQRITSS